MQHHRGKLLSPDGMHTECTVLTRPVAVSTGVKSAMFAAGVRSPTVIGHNRVFNRTVNIQSL